MSIITQPGNPAFSWHIVIASTTSHHAYEQVRTITERCTQFQTQVDKISNEIAIRNTHNAELQTKVDESNNTIAIIDNRNGEFEARINGSENNMATRSSQWVKIRAPLVVSTAHEQQRREPTKRRFKGQVDLRARIKKMREDAETRRQWHEARSKELERELVEEKGKNAENAEAKKQSAKVQKQWADMANLFQKHVQQRAGEDNGAKVKDGGDMDMNYLDSQCV
ncbi:hypothetical protein EJ02DRAFT_425339 [Clathrospora elynae]|uniref:Uncharacterized protein n=1 Tax=Clathrospora elynae TaxID=706981 RepID=A0A6A5SGC4_9PLEO|nr:hypothetical protein EJ02DRAFT_425339 [Clathrospora elynae]